MKKILNLGLLLLFVSISGKTQDTSLYQGLSNIYLRSGKEFKQVTLWTIDTLKVEYVKNGNLSEVLTIDVLKIGTLDYEITFDGQNRVVKREYDLIISPYGDTIKGFIFLILNDRYNQFMEYYPATGRHKKKTAYKSYVRALNTKYKIMKKKETEMDVKNEDDENINTTLQNNHLNKDLIITNKDDSLWCTILKVGETKIDYIVRKIGHDRSSFIPKSAVKKYFNNTYDSKFVKYDTLSSAKFKSSNSELSSHNFDLIFTMAGDSIMCNIIKVGDDQIYYHISIPGRDPKIRISRNLIRQYIDSDKKNIRNR